MSCTSSGVGDMDLVQDYSKLRLDDDGDEVMMV